MADAITKPDYVFWSKWDEWIFKDAALLLHGFEPLELKQAKFIVTKPPEEPELQEAHKTFLLLKHSNWRDLGLITSNSTHPYAIEQMARHKDLPFPQEIAECLNARRKREQINPHPSHSINAMLQEMELPPEKNKEVSAHSRERRNSLKIIGILVLLLEKNKKKTSKLKHNESLSASQIKDIILEKAEHFNIETDGLKSIDRKIAEAMALLRDEIEEVS
jgi:hypothetical protein